MTHRRAVSLPPPSTHRARWGHPPTSARHADGRDTLHRYGNAVHAARTAAAGEEHPRAGDGLARAVAVQRRAARGGALDARPNAARITIRRKRRQAGTCTSTSASSSAPREKTGETPRGGEATERRAGRRASWSGVTREFPELYTTKTLPVCVFLFRSIRSLL
jgi:hypothetical protein